MNPLAPVSMLGRSTNGAGLALGAAVLVALIYARVSKQSPSPTAAR